MVSGKECTPQIQPGGTMAPHRWPGISSIPASYNQRVRTASAFFLLLCLTACHSGQNKDAVRQGVLDHLTQAGLNMAGMDVTLISVQFSGNQADASVTITAKGASAAQGMQMKYHLEQKDNKWVVVSRQDSSQHSGGALPPGAGNPHGGAGMGGATPGGADPHAGGAMGAPAAGGKMPSPDELPPATKKQ